MLNPLAKVALPPCPSGGNQAWWHHTWLSAGGSLTARLRQMGHVQVHVQFQGSQRLWPAEQQALRVSSGHVREVILTVDGQAVVWARSATTHTGLKGPWKALKGLGNRALAELLFSHAKVQRGPLHAHAWRRHSQAHARATKQWQHHHAHQAIPHASVALAQAPRKARASVFWHKGKPLRVMEAFSPRLSSCRHTA
jgi:chorismate lyase